MQRERWWTVENGKMVGKSRVGEKWANGNGCHQVIFGGQDALIFHSQPGISFHSISRALFTFWQTHFLHSPGKIEKKVIRHSERSQLTGKGIENQVKPCSSSQPYIPRKT